MWGDKDPFTILGKYSKIAIIVTTPFPSSCLFFSLYICCPDILIIVITFPTLQSVCSSMIFFLRIYYGEILSPVSICHGFNHAAYRHSDYFLFVIVCAASYIMWMMFVL